jgi:hypothetical protein
MLPPLSLSLSLSLSVVVTAESPTPANGQNTVSEIRETNKLVDK